MKQILIGVALAVLGSIPAANADVVWTTWTTGVADPVNGSASSTLGGISVGYTGEMDCLNCFASDWSPAKIF